MFQHFNRRSEKGFITMQVMVSFIVINALMAASFLFGSKIREVQDTNYEIKKREKALIEKQQAEERRRQQLAAQAASKQPASPQKKVGVIDVAQNQQKTPPPLPVNVKAPIQLKRIIVSAPLQPPPQKPPDQPAKPPVASQQPKNSATVKKTATASAGETQPVETPSGFSERFSSLFEFSELDSFGVELYDQNIVRASQGREIAILRFINRIRITDAGLQPEDTSEALAYNQKKVEQWSKNSPAAAVNGKAADTSEVNHLKSGGFIGKYLYAYKEFVYIGSGYGVRRIKITDIPDAGDLKKDTKFNHEEYLPEKLPQTDTIAMCSNGSNILFWGTVNEIYMIDLDAGEATPIGDESLGIVDIIESGRRYPIYYYRNKLFFANSDALYYYDVAGKSWHYITYELFTDYKNLDVSGLLMFDDPKETPGFVILTNNVGILIGRMPAFDLKLTDYEGKYRYKARRGISSKNNAIPPRDFVASPPCFAFGDANNLWISFFGADSLPCEILRYDIRERLIDKISENCERHYESKKVESLFAADMAVLNKDITVAVNGVDVFAILRFRDKDNEKVFNYGFIEICKITNSYAVCVSGNSVICSTSDGKILKVNVKF